MAFTTLISVHDLLSHLLDPQWAIVDCRFYLNDPSYGFNQYLEKHISGAVYAHLDEDLCSPVIPGTTGRHPLPEVSQIVQRLSDWGIDQATQVVTYDDAGGSMAAARLWWLLKWLGHENVAVLDGGWQAWVHAGYPTQSGEEKREPRTFRPQPKPELFVTTEFVEQILDHPNYLILDSRTRERYLGEKEPIDPIAGHIPGAICVPYTENIHHDGCFLSKNDLRLRFKSIVGEIPSDRVVFYCGSGVTAAQNILAMVHAGLGFAKLYAGSWSEWITNPERPIAKG